MQRYSMLAAWLVVGWAGTATADQAAGQIKSFDPNNRTFVLDNGTMFVLDDAVRTPTVYAGRKVTVTFTKGDKGNVATKVDD